MGFAERLFACPDSHVKVASRVLAFRITLNNYGDGRVRLRVLLIHEMNRYRDSAIPVVRTCSLSILS
jgi:hypothetical protein